MMNDAKVRRHSLVHRLGCFCIRVYMVNGHFVTMILHTMTRILWPRCYGSSSNESMYDYVAMVDIH